MEQGQDAEFSDILIAYSRSQIYLMDLQEPKVQSRALAAGLCSVWCSVALEPKCGCTPLPGLCRVQFLGLRPLVWYEKLLIALSSLRQRDKTSLGSDCCSSEFVKVRQALFR